MRVWRISKAKFAESSFSGEGARLFDGRWNFAGVRMVYASLSLALAAIEFFIHLDPTVAPDDLVSVRAAIPDNISVPSLDLSALPRNWRTVDNRALRQMGSDWIKSGSSVALRVPSAAVDGEWNVLMNPLHADFRKIRVDAPKAFRFDERMFAGR